MSQLYRTLSAPIVIHLELTGNCNCSCRHCYNYFRNSDVVSDASAHMSQNTAERIMVELVKNKVPEVVLTGGEPFLNWPILQFFVIECSKYGINFSINSNLSCLTQEKLDWLMAHKAKRFLVSLMSYDKATHDFIASTQGAYQKTVRGLKLCLKNGVSPMVNMVVSQYNQQDVFKTAKFVAKLGIKRFAATPVVCPVNCTNQKALELSRTEMHDVFNTLIDVKEQLGLQVDVLTAIPTCVLPYLKAPTNYFSRRCSAGILMAVLGSNGEMRACPNSDKNYGSVLDENMSSIWTRMTPYRTGELIPDKCKTCKIFHLCGGGCRMSAKMRNNRQEGCPDVLMDENVIPETLKIYQDLHHPKKLKLPETGKIKFLYTRIRAEEFGCIIWNSQYRWLLLDKVGYELFKNLDLNKEYEISEIINSDNRAFFDVLYNNSYIALIK